MHAWLSVCILLLPLCAFSSSLPQSLLIAPSTNKKGSRKNSHEASSKRERRSFYVTAITDRKDTPAYSHSFVVVVTTFSCLRASSIGKRPRTPRFQSESESGWRFFSLFVPSTREKKRKLTTASERRATTSSSLRNRPSHCCFRPKLDSVRTGEGTFTFSPRFSHL